MRRRRRLTGLFVLALAGAWAPAVRGQAPPLALPASPAVDHAMRPLPINLPTALQLSGVAPIDVQVAGQRLQIAAAQLTRAKTLWLPTISAGVDYARQDGRIQDVVGTVFSTSKSSFMVGFAPTATFAISDALFAPLAARQIVQARNADLQTAKNDSLLNTAEAYFNVQQVRGELAGATESLARAEEVVRRVEQLAPGLLPAVEVNRAKTELAKRRFALESAAERWQTASAQLSQILRLDPTAVVDPVEPPQLRIDLVDPNQPLDDLIAMGLQQRPELASHRAEVAAAVARIRQERLRPLVPSVLMKGNATNPAGTLSTGAFGGGINGDVSNFGLRNGYDVQLLWEVQNLGFGNRAAVREREGQRRVASLELTRTQDRVASEVAQAAAQALRSAARVPIAEEELRNALETIDKSLEGLKQTRRTGETISLVQRPQEVVAAIASLDQSYRDYYGAVGDANRAQFRLYRALGRPAECVGVERGDSVKSVERPAPVAK